LVSSLIDSVAAKMPESRDNLVSSKELTEIKFIMEWNIEYYKVQTNPENSLRTNSGLLQVTLIKIGLRGIAAN